MSAAAARLTDTRIGPAITTVTLSPVGGRDPRPIQGIDPRFTWEVSNVGAASVDVATDDALALAGWGASLSTLRGRWLGYDHPTAGLWGGIVTDVRPRPDGLTELAARGWAELLAKRRTPRSDRALTGPPGAIVRRAMTDVGREDFTWIADVQADETGEPLTVQLRGESLLDLIRRMAARGDNEWIVAQDRVLHWRTRVGVDRRASVQLIEGVHVLEVTPTWSIDPVVNDLYATPADDRYERTTGVTVLDEDSIAAVGRRQERIAFAGAVTKSVLRPMARSVLARLARRGVAVSATVADVDGCWGWFGDGDTIRLVVPSIDQRFDLRVLVRTFEPANGLLRISGVPR